MKVLGLPPQKIPGRGQVTMIRLLEGIYPEAEARNRLKELKKTVKSKGFEIRIKKHKKFVREGADLYTDVKIKYTVLVINILSCFSLIILIIYFFCK